MSQPSIAILSGAELDAALDALDATQRKILGGLVVTMIKHHDRIRDKEWFAKQFASAVALTTELEDTSSTFEGVERVQSYAAEHFVHLGGVGFGIFARVAQDMQERPGFTFEDASARVLHYLQR